MVDEEKSSILGKLEIAEKLGKKSKKDKFKGLVELTTSLSKYVNIWKRFIFENTYKKANKTYNNYKIL